MRNLRKQAFDSGVSYSLLHDQWKENVCNVYAYDALFLIYRQMRGEELEGLSVEELQQLEKNLEAGLHRVLQTKVR